MIQKFRAWDKEKKRWMTKVIEDVEESEVRLDLWGSVTFRLPWYEHENNAVATVDGSDIFDLMQSTGINDKNDIEIFEGDIVSYFRKGNSVIEWKDGGFIIKRVMDGEYEFMQSRTAEIEVIGNIYENPELLELADGISNNSNKK